MASKFSTTIHGCTGTVLIGDNANLTVTPGYRSNQEERQTRTEVRQPTTVPCQETSGSDELNYKLNSGYVLIINNQLFPSRADVERSGSEQDVYNMKDFFERVNLHPIRIHENLDSSEMKKVLEETAEKDFKRYDCFICVILSHGTRDGILGTDNKHVEVDYITSLFRSSGCPSLDDKPKLFFIQACRGNEQDITVESDSEPIALSYPKLPADSDFLVCYASSPCLQSYRSPEFGSWFILSIAEVFRKYASREHVMDMMLRVNKKVASFCSSKGQKQMPSEVCMLTKKIYFNAPFEFD